MSTNTDSKARLVAALNLLAGRQADDQITPGDVTAFPVARIRQGMQAFLAYPTVEELLDARVDFGKVLQNLFAWDDPRSTKVVTKAASAALQARDEHGNSLYPQAVEMLSFAAAAAPLLQPDRLARLIGLAPTVATAYRPILWPAKVAAGLKQMVEKYPEQRRETLLGSLWTLAHSGRWWEKLQYDKAPNRPARGRRRPDIEEGEELALRDMLLIGVPTVGHWDPDNPARIAALRFDRKELKLLAERFDDNRLDPDLAVAGSQIVGLAPTQRPPTPLDAIVDTTVGVHEFLVDTDGLDAIPDKPTTWAQLCPGGDARPFPIPREVLTAFHSVTLPGFDVDGNGNPGSWVRICRNPGELSENATFMGNCTGGWRSRSESGNEFIVRAHVVGDNDYNACVRRTGNGWSFGEINSRFNRRQVPDQVRQAFETLLRRAHAAAGS